jgi:hypothetical protein
MQWLQRRQMAQGMEAIWIRCDLFQEFSMRHRQVRVEVNEVAIPIL